MREAVIGRLGTVVLHGPFAGLRHSGLCAGGAPVPEFLGCYEEELHPWLEDLVQTGYERVVNVGSGEGYYAVGFAMRMANAKVYAFDLDPVARNSCAQMAAANGVADRVIVRGECTCAALAEVAEPATLVFMDCEGFEVELLNLSVVPGLAQCDILVEMHDFLRHGATATIRSRFSLSHTVRKVSARERDPDAYPELSCLSRAERRLAVDEDRPEMHWLLLLRKG